MAIVEGKWDCSYCSTIGIRGSMRNCPNCGQPRNESTAFYLGDSPRRLSDEEGAKHGVADWVCEYCGALNADSNTQCKGCGAAKSGVSYHDKHPERRRVLSVEEARRPPSVERSTTPAPSPSSSSTPSPHSSTPISLVGGFIRHNKGMLYRILAIIAVLAVVGVGVWALWPKPQTGAVAGFRWTHTVEYEEYREVREEGWSIPIGGVKFPP